MWTIKGKILCTISDINRIKKRRNHCQLGTLLQLLFITVQVSTRALKMRAKISSLKTD